MTSTKTSIGVIFGGVSGEHDVSIQSARNIIKALKSVDNIKKFNVISFYIDKRGKWHSGDFSKQILCGNRKENKENSPVKTLSDNLLVFSQQKENIDIWFPVLHGPNGEDGTIQGLLKLTGRPFVGSGVLGSSVGMDKLIMKAIFSSQRLAQVPYIGANISQLNNNLRTELIQKVENELGYPCFIKPANLGSSVGITKAKNKSELIKGLIFASEFDPRVVIEKAVLARELECGVVGNKNMEVTEVGEVTFDSDWYDYKTKYGDGNSNVVIPALINSQTKNEIQAMAIRACEAICANGLARVDFFYNEEINQIWINEINTMPGFTSQSMFPMLWEASGLKTEKLVAKLIEIAKE